MANSIRKLARVHFPKCIFVNVFSVRVFCEVYQAYLHIFLANWLLAINIFTLSSHPSLLCDQHFKRFSSMKD